MKIPKFAHQFFWTISIWKITFLSSFHQHSRTPPLMDILLIFHFASNFLSDTNYMHEKILQIVAKRHGSRAEDECACDGETERECFVWQATIKFIWNMWNVKCILMRHKFFSSPLSLLAASLLSLLLFFSLLFFVVRNQLTPLTVSGFNLKRDSHIKNLN